jgi:rubredoxin---NAD+ reductase
MQPLVIVGSGLAGYLLAKEVRQGNVTKPIVMVTRADGAFYSKPMLSNALASQKTPEALVQKTAETMAKELDMRIVAHTPVTAINARKKTISFADETLEYDQLVLATGSEVVRSHLKGDAVDQVFSVNDLEDYKHFRDALQGKKRIVVIGAGLIGVEFANDLSRAGFDVEVVSTDQWAVQRLLPEAPARLLQSALDAKGVTWHFDALASSVNKTDNGFVLRCISGMEIEADLIFSAIGIVPDLALGKLADVEMKRGIVVDYYLKTSVKDVFALGDCAEVRGQVSPYVAPLRLCAQALGKTLTGTPTRVIYPRMAVKVKTPDCPMRVLPRPSEVKGEWQCEQDDTGSRHLFYDTKQRLQGFVLTGEKAIEVKQWLEASMTEDEKVGEK